jgi:ADP-heptose:LPS heptosyltransferase
MRYPDGINEVERHLRLMEFLGVPLRGKELEFPLTREEEEIAGRLSDEFDLKPTKYVCIHPGARDEKRRWRPEYFAKIADELVDRGFKAVLTGTSAEAEVVSRVENNMRHPAVNLAGKTELGVLAVLIRNSRLLICNDTGVSHLAAALELPSVVIFLQSDPARWAPLNSDRHDVILPHEAGCIDRVLFNVKHKLLDKSVNRNSLRVA